MGNLEKRNNVVVRGHGQRTMMFAHGFGCDQNMWHFIVPAFENDYRILLFDHVGAGGSDLTTYSFDKYSSLRAYAQDIVELGRAYDVRGGIFVGHSVAAMMGILAAIEAPDMFDALVLIGPSPCYINDGEYVGGFSRAQIEELLEFLDSNHMGWSTHMAPVIMGNPDRPELGEELTNSFCRTDPEIAKHFARTTFFSDNRADLPKVATPALVLQCSEDVIAPEAVGQYVHRQLSKSRFVRMQATGHCPNLSAPEETVTAMQAFLREHRFL